MSRVHPSSGGVPILALRKEVGGAYLPAEVVATCEAAQACIPKKTGY